MASDRVVSLPRKATAFIVVGLRKDGVEVIPAIPCALDEHRECLERGALKMLREVSPDVEWRAEPLFTDHPLNLRLPSPMGGVA